MVSAVGNQFCLLSYIDNNPLASEDTSLLDPLHAMTLSCSQYSTSIELLQFIEWLTQLQAEKLNSMVLKEELGYVLIATVSWAPISSQISSIRINARGECGWNYVELYLRDNRT